MTVRSAKEEDLAFVEETARDRIPDTLSSETLLRPYLSDPDFLLLILEEEDDVGYLLFRLEGKEAEIDEIALRRGKDGMGRGSTLLEEGLAVLRKKGISKVFLEVRAANESAIRLYEKAGFRPYRVRKGYYGNEDALCYQKELI
jgi:ribosomal-protein-alanine N-acetyltransferase